MQRGWKIGLIIGIIIILLLGGYFIFLYKNNSYTPKEYDIKIDLLNQLNNIPFNNASDLEKNMNQYYPVIEDCNNLILGISNGSRRSITSYPDQIESIANKSELLLNVDCYDVNYDHYGFSKDNIRNTNILLIYGICSCNIKINEKN